MTRRLVLGTGNRKKAAELVTLLAPLGLQLETLADFPAALDVEETGQTFAENAALKAQVQARHLGRWVLAEDSGLAVDALGGRPGVYSARYSGPAATDATNNALLLAELAGVGPADRGARYECHLALADPQGQLQACAAGQCRGRIRTAAAGAAGFGYDPLFELPEYHRTFGELGETVKHLLSHRRRAIEGLLVELRRLIDSAAWPDDTRA
jgi:XTP/dITP diphosphohydrolase